MTESRLWWALGRLLIGEDISKREFIAIKNKLIDFPGLAKNHNIQIEDINRIITAKQLAEIFKKYKPTELGEMFYQKELK